MDTDLILHDVIKLLIINQSNLTEDIISSINSLDSWSRVHGEPLFRKTTFDTRGCNYLIPKLIRDDLLIRAMSEERQKAINDANKS